MRRCLRDSMPTMSRMRQATQTCHRLPHQVSRSLLLSTHTHHHHLDGQASQRRLLLRLRRPSPGSKPNSSPFSHRKAAPPPSTGHSLESDLKATSALTSHSSTATPTVNRSNPGSYDSSRMAPPRDPNAQRGRARPRRSRARWR